MSNKAPVGSGLGNTNSKPERVNSSKRWCFTLFNYDELYQNLITKLNSIDCTYVIGKEVCPTTKKKHLQGYVEFKLKTRPIEKIGIKTIHWEKAKGSTQDNITYCTKDNDFVVKGLYAPKKIKLITDLYNWQLDVIDIVKKEPHDRHIYWYVDTQGNRGKTQLCKYLSHHFGAVPLDGERKDILYCASVFESNCYVWNIPRGVKHKNISYTALESIKDGYYMCAKYESKPVIRNSPHVIVFANFYPDEEKLSPDRWVIKELTG